MSTIFANLLLRFLNTIPCKISIWQFICKASKPRRNKSSVCWIWPWHLRCQLLWYCCKHIGIRRKSRYLLRSQHRMPPRYRLRLWGDCGHPLSSGNSIFSLFTLCRLIPLCLRLARLRARLVFVLALVGLSLVGFGLVVSRILEDMFLFLMSLFHIFALGLARCSCGFGFLKFLVRLVLLHLCI